jgi:TLC domain
LARHIGVDATSCFVCAYLGYIGRHIIQEVFDSIFKKKPFPKAFEKRMLTYYPEAARLSLFFFAYQIKNSYDTVVWNDGLLFVFHHILSLTTCWGSLFPGTGQAYAVFYFGISEVSTGILCLLANFDQHFGVDGLAAAFPTAKVVLGALFAVSFIVCRVVMWSAFSYYYVSDGLAALNSNLDPKFHGHIPWLRFFFVTLSCLTALQILWLGEIFSQGYKELATMGIV